MLLLSFYLSLFTIASALAEYSAPEQDLSVLSFYLSNQFPSLSEISKPWVLLTYSFTDPVIEFSSASGELVFPSSESERNIQKTFLESSHFSISAQPITPNKRNLNQSLTVTFQPSSIGTKSAYLVVITQENLIVYYLIGVCIDAGFKLSPIRIYHQLSAYGVAELTIANPQKTDLAVINVKTLNKKLSIQKTKSWISGPDSQEIAVIRSYFSETGDFLAYIEVELTGFKFLIPVFVKVFLPQLDVPKKIDFGIISGKNKGISEELGVRSFSNDNIKVINIISNSKNFIVKFMPKNVPKLSERTSVCTVRFVSKHEGNFIAKIELVTAHQVYFITCYAIVSFGFAYIPKAPFLSPNSEISFITDVKNKLGVDLLLEDFSSDSGSVFISSSSKNSVKISLKNSGENTYWLAAKSSLGNLHFCLAIVEPLIKIYKEKNEGFFEINEPVIFGQFSRNFQLNSKFLIENLNDFQVRVLSISCAGLCQSSFNSTEIDPFGGLEFNLEFNIINDIDECVKIYTSVGMFFIHVSIEVLDGTVQARPVFLSEVISGTKTEEFIFIYNGYPRPINILSISSNSKDIELTVIEKTILPYKEHIISKAQVFTQSKKQGVLNWDSFLTFGDVQSWSTLQTPSSEHEKIDIIVDFDISGKVKIPVFFSVKDSQFPIKSFSEHRNCSISDTCLLYVYVQNPFPFPVSMQILPSSQLLEEEILNNDCRFLPSDWEDSDSGKILAERKEKKRKCSAKQNEEILVKSFTEKKENKLEKEPKNLASKIRDFIELAFKIPEKKLKKDQNFWHGNEYYTSKEVFTLPGNSSKILGPIYYTPSAPGSYVLPFILRNNFTVIQNFKLKAKVSSEKLSIMKRSNYIFAGKNYTLHRSSIRKEQQKLAFEVAPEEYQNFYLSNSLISATFIRTFDIQNLGTTDLEISFISFDMQKCSSFGFFINNCDRAFVLRPSEIHSFQLDYSPNLFIYNQPLFVYIKSNLGLHRYQIDLKISEYSGIEQFLHLYPNEISVIFFGFVIAAVVSFIRFRPKPRFFKSFSSLDQAVAIPAKILFKQFSEPVFIQQESVVPTIIEEPKILSESPKEILPVSKHKKPKTKNNLNVIKCEGKVKKVQNKGPEIIANNKFLLEKKPKKTVSDEPAPMPYESDSEDYFIDSYKTRNALFGQFYSGESFALAELSKDSETLDS